MSLTCSILLTGIEVADAWADIASLCALESSCSLNHRVAFFQSEKPVVTKAGSDFMLMTVTCTFCVEAVCLQMF